MFRLKLFLDFVYGNYHIPYHEATVDNSGIDCLQKGCAALGECAACADHGSLGYCCNPLGTMVLF